MSKNLHHANLLVASVEEAEGYLSKLCNELGFTFANNPDFFAFRAETFGIDEARQLRLLAARKSINNDTGSKKIFLIAPSIITLEAQNALLKTFEDPFPDTYFFLVMSKEGAVIPTLHSRMETIRVRQDFPPLSQDQEEFMSLSPAKRLIFAKKFVDEDKNLSVFLDGLLLYLRGKNGSEKSVEVVYNVSRTLNKTTPSARLIIEHLALVL